MTSATAMTQSLHASSLSLSLSLLNAMEMSKVLSTLTRRQKDTYNLNCYIAGDNSAFFIPVLRTAKVSDLAQKISESGISDRDDLSVVKMIMWRVCQDWRAF
jgi:GTP cyclohydrolase III